MALHVVTPEVKTFFLCPLIMGWHVGDVTLNFVIPWKAFFNSIPRENKAAWKLDAAGGDCWWLTPPFIVLTVRV